MNTNVRMTVCLSGLGENVIFSVSKLGRGLISSSFATYGCCHPYSYILGNLENLFDILFTGTFILYGFGNQKFTETRKDIWKIKVEQAGHKRRVFRIMEAADSYP